MADKTAEEIGFSAILAFANRAEDRVEGIKVNVLDQRRFVLEEAHALHPERFVRGFPKPSRPAAKV